MKTNHKLDSVFGAAGQFSGGILIAVGIITLLQIVGIVLIILGLYLYTYTGTEFDTDKKQIRHYNALFGFYKIGKVINFSQLHGFKVTQTKMGYNVYSRSNRLFSNSNNDFRVMLIGYNPKIRIPISKHKTLNEAAVEMQKLSLLLKLPLI